MYSRKGYMDETYEILGYLGSGSGGVIYKAYHKRLQKEVVLKKIKRKSRDARINRNEVDILKNLNHMYLPQVVDFFEENGEIYTAMSFIPGRSLKELMEERRQFSQRQLIRWAMQLCSAIVQCIELSAYPDATDHSWRYQAGKYHGDSEGRCLSD